MALANLSILFSIEGVGKTEQKPGGKVFGSSSCSSVELSPVADKTFRPKRRKKVRSVRSGARRTVTRVHTKAERLDDVEIHNDIH
jgi:hypothetical protein